MSDTVQLCRLRAQACEQRARVVSDPAVRREWEDVAMQWHLLANVAAELGGERGLLRED
jgi:hypothetical protein